MRFAMRKMIVACSLAAVAVVFVLYLEHEPETIRAGVAASAGGNSVIKSIVSLKAYCILAREQVMNSDEFKDKLKNGVVEFIEAFGQQKGKELVGEYAGIIGELEAKHPNTPGMFVYILDSLNSNVLKGKPVVELSKGKMMMIPKAFGFRETPTYFRRLGVSLSEFSAAHTKLHEGTGGEAIKAWVKSGQSDVFQQHYAKVVAKYMRQQQANQVLIEEGAQVAMQVSLKENLENEDSDTEPLQPLPVAGIMGSSTVRAKTNFTMPSAEDMKKEALKMTKAHMKEITGSNPSADKIVQKIEDIMKGTTIKMTTSGRMFADSHQAPTIKIVGTLGSITGTVEALPLNGATLTQTFSSSEGSIGQATHIILENDKKVENPWLCTKFLVQVGHGNAWIEFTPEGKKSFQDGWWLEGANGKAGPYYRLARAQKWLLLPSSQLLTYTKMHDGKVPNCANLKDGCFDGSRADFEKACDENRRCQGFSYTHGEKEGGRGCLKYRCDSKDMDTDTEPDFVAGRDYYTKQAFEYTKSDPTEKCPTKCGFEGATYSGKVWCRQLADQKKVHDDKCAFWRPSILKPAVPTKKCAPTAPCEAYQSAGH